MFNFVKSLDCAVPQTSLEVAASGTYEVGMALKIASGKLTKATGGDVVTHICAENKKLTADGLLVAYPVTDAMLFEVPVSAVSASNALICIDNVDIALRNALNGALGSASAACDASIGNLVCHGMYLQ